MLLRERTRSLLQIALISSLHLSLAANPSRRNVNFSHHRENAGSEFATFSLRFSYPMNKTHAWLYASY
jgi:hypothetical protein